MNKSLLLPFLMFLTGCETPEQMEERLLATASARCEAYGYSPATNQFASCMQSERQSMAQQQMAASTALIGMGQQMSQPAPSPVSCTSVRNGVFVNTTCR